MARIGTEKRPAVLRVQTERRAQEVANICAANGIHFLASPESSTRNRQHCVLWLEGASVA